MSIQNQTLGQRLTGTDTGPLLLDPIARASVALQVATNVRTKQRAFRIPIISADPSAAWLAEGAEITTSEAQAREVSVDLRKIAGLSQVTNETATDTSPEAASLIGEGLARDIATKIDAAFFGTKGVSLVQPAGLEDLAGVTTIKADPTTGLDPYVDALAAAEAVGASVSAFVAHPDVARDLSKVKTQTGSNALLLGGDANNGISRSVLGVPVLVSAAVSSGTVWGLPTDRVFAVIREDVEIVVDTSRYLEFDATAIRAVARLGFGFPQASSIVKIKAK